MLTAFFAVGAFATAAVAIVLLLGSLAFDLGLCKHSVSATIVAQ